jgi:Ca-activated chloride channel family protein
MRNLMRIGAAALMLVAAAAVEARAAGLLVPKDEAVPPLAVKYLRVDTSIIDQAATTRVTQEFQNATPSDLECTFVFPVPKGAAIRDFAMWVGGKRVQGELLEKDRAREVYEQIVRRARDPGLLEYLDGSVLRMRIYPVPAKGTQKVEVEYTELVPMDEGLAEYRFPMRVGDKASRTLEDLTLAVRIRSKVPIKSVYSPTHDLGVTRPSDHEAVAGTEMKAAALDRDFHLFYTVGEQDVGLNLMTWRPDPRQPGMFLALVSPRSEGEDRRRVPRDVAFVLDTSGSMKEEAKILQARAALAFCIDKLARDDRFAILPFSTAVQAFADGWTEASDRNRKKAREWIDALEAGGGTNLSDALERVFALGFDEKRPAMILLLTDGRPTVNTTDLEALAKIVKEHNRRNLRIFTFGVGDDVNTHLLDRMTEDTGGVPEYVRQGEAIDGKVTRLFAKMSHPVLTDLAIEIPGVRVTEMYPQRLPDLFRGAQVVIAGAYTGAGDSIIRLTGRTADKRETFTYEGTFPEKTTERPFVGSIFAHRKIGFLLDQIRLHGESKELRDEVVRLSLAHGIETPYTSYLVLENEAQYKQYGIQVVGTGGSGYVPPAPAWGTGAATAQAGPVPAAPAADMADAMRKGGEARERAAERIDREMGLAPAAKPQDAGAAKSSQPEVPRGGGVRVEVRALREEQTGKTAVDIAQDIKRLREADSDARPTGGGPTVQHRAGRPFVNYRGVWVDERFQGTERLTRVRWGSEAYFGVLRARPELGGPLSLGVRVVVATAAGKALVVDDDAGAETLDAAAIQDLFQDAGEAGK